MIKRKKVFLKGQFHGIISIQLHALSKQLPSCNTSCVASYHAPRMCSGSGSSSCSGAHFHALSM
jgi:hypothetical protein